MTTDHAFRPMPQYPEVCGYSNGPLLGKCYQLESKHTGRACRGMAHVPCDDCGGSHPPNWAHGERELPCCDLDSAARKHTRQHLYEITATQNRSLRDRIMVAEATQNVDEFGVPMVTMTRDGVESLTINGVDLFKWFATAHEHGLSIHVRLEVNSKIMGKIGERVKARERIDAGMLSVNRGHVGSIIGHEDEYIRVAFDHAGVWLMKREQLEPQ